MTVTQNLLTSAVVEERVCSGTTFKDTTVQGMEEKAFKMWIEAGLSRKSSSKILRKREETVSIIIHPIESPNNSIAQVNTGKFMTTSISQGTVVPCIYRLHRVFP